jgi:hypothetical protein
VKIPLCEIYLTFYSNLETIGQTITNPFHSSFCTALLLNSGSINLNIRKENSVMDNNHDDDKFYTWFVGFSDAEAMFGIFPLVNDKKTNIERFSFRFIIGLHQDDVNALIYIKNKLGFGYVYANKDTQRFIVSKKEDIKKLISIFDKYSLNSTKFLDYIDFKKAFTLYYEREGLVTEALIDQILTLKNGMNTKRTNFNMPDHEIILNKS